MVPRDGRVACTHSALVAVVPAPLLAALAVALTDTVPFLFPRGQIRVDLLLDLAHPDLFMELLLRLQHRLFTALCRPLESAG